MPCISKHKAVLACALALALALSLPLVTSGLAQEAQVLNPQFVEARGLWAKVGAAPLSSDIKAPLGERFGHLARMQQRLWSLAGQVDGGSCAGACVADYNREVIAWQGALGLFNRDAENALRLVPNPDPRPPAAAVPWGK